MSETENAEPMFACDDAAAMDEALDRRAQTICRLTEDLKEARAAHETTAGQLHATTSALSFKMDEITRLKAIVSDLVKAAEPCLNAWERFECGDVEIDAEWLRSEIADGLTWGDLRSLSEAVARAGKEVK